MSKRSDGYVNVGNDFDAWTEVRKIHSVVSA